MRSARRGLRKTELPTLSLREKGRTPRRYEKANGAHLGRRWVEFYLSLFSLSVGRLSVMYVRNLLKFPNWDRRNSKNASRTFR